VDGNDAVRERLGIENHDQLTIGTDGVVDDFTSTGIDDNATSTQVTITDTLMTVGRLNAKSVYPSIAQYGGTAEISGTYWKLGSMNLGGSLSAKIRVGGTQSFSAGSNISGETTIHLRGGNATTTIDGHFYGSTKGNTMVANVCYVNTASNEFDIYIRTYSTYAGLDTWVDCAGTWTPNLTDTGSTTAPAGSIAFPSLYAIATNGAERMRIDSSGNVGIGTSSPTTILTIKKPIDSAAYGSGTRMIDFKSYFPGYDESNVKSSIYSGVSDKGTHDTDGGYLAFLVSDDSETLNEHMRIEKNGNVGIGTDSPASALAVAGAGDAAIDIISDIDNNGTNQWAILNFKRNSPSASPSARIYQKENDNALVFDNNGSEAMRIDSSGNVGIGTNNPNGIRLTVRKSDATDGQRLATFDGSDTNQSFCITNYFCGSDEDRVGVYWENEGVLNQRMWCDDTGDIRVSSGNPTADNSGTVVGTQTFTGTHIYKSSDESLITGEAVKLVDRKLVRCTVTKDPTCIGIFIGKSDKIQDSFEAPCSYDYWHDSVLYTDEDELPEGVVVGDVKTESYLEVKNPDEGYPYAVASLGDTIANVSGNKLEGVLVDCSVTAGDLLCTAVDGRLTKQDDDIIHSYTVAKAGEDGDSNNPVYAYVYCG